MISTAGHYDHLVKMLLIGDSGVGKTNILLRYCDNNFLPSHLTTIGIDFKIKIIEVEHQRLKLQIWDTAGQERFRTVTNTYFKNSHGVILCYSVIDMDSFHSIESWIQQLKQHAPSNVCQILVGNKSDLEQRQVTFEQGEALAKTYGLPFLESSAQTGDNIIKIFQSLALDIKHKLLKDVAPVRSQSPVHLVDETGKPKRKKRSWC